MRKSKKKKLLVIFVCIIAIFLLLGAAFLVYASDYYKADDVARAFYENDTDLSKNGDYFILKPEVPSDTALIFYPGAKVETIAYLPILEKLKANGITCILVDMPFHMAIFDSDAAKDAFSLLPDIKNWYIGGHSMGGAMAGSYASKNQDKVDGLILLGAYIYGGYPAKDSLTIYGTYNSNLEKHIDYTENIVVIDGGNHAQFGNYGKQKGDPDADITSEEQQDIAVNAIMDFVEK